MRRIRLLMLALVAAQAFAAAAQTANPLTIVAAKRGKSFIGARGDIRPRDENADVVIMLRVQGLSRQEFLKIDQDAIYVLSGQEKLPATVAATGTIAGKPEMLIVVVGPKTPLNMKLVLGTYPAVEFKAEAAIAEKLP